MKVYCPNCGSDNIFFVLPQTWSKYECRDCGYIGALVISDGELAKEIRDEWMNEKGGENDEQGVSDEEEP
jgi:transposase-like protein